VVVEGASVVVGATVVVVTEGSSIPGRTRSDATEYTTSTRMAITRALRTFVVCFGAVLAPLARRASPNGSFAVLSAPYIAGVATIS